MVKTGEIFLFLSIKINFCFITKCINWVITKVCFSEPIKFYEKVIEHQIKGTLEITE